MTRRRRVVAYVTRDTDGGRELLVFEDPKHPHIGVQVPAGRLDPDEELEPAVLRELAEEAGLHHVRIVRELPGFEGSTRAGTRTMRSSSSRTRSCPMSGSTSWQARATTRG